MLNAKSIKYRGALTLDEKKFTITDKGSVRLLDIYESIPVSSVVIEIKAGSISDVNISLSYFKSDNTTKYFVEMHMIPKNSVGYIVVNYTFNVVIDIVGKCEVTLKSLRIRNIK